ncbi:MAG: thioredoxin family protein [Planctomycetes bacterium]|nr:thioredoxin family protein [Planctomycetota bacterium]
MAVNLEERFARGVSLEEFIEGADARQMMQWSYDNTILTDDQLEALRGFDRKMNMLVVAAVWCPDSQANVPVMAKIADSSPNIDMRIVNRDDNEDLMQEHLTNGGMRIPLCLMLSQDFYLVERWTERPARAYRFLYDLRQQGVSGDAARAKFMRQYHSTGMIEATVSELIGRIGRAGLILALSRRLDQMGASNDA